MISMSSLVTPPEGACETVSGECQQHGAYESPALWIGNALVNETPECPDCSDMVAFVEKYNAEKEDERRREKWLRKRIVDSGVPIRIRGAANYIPPCPRAEKNLEAVKNYSANFQETFDTGANLLLTGNPGTGKTHLAGKLAINLITKFDHAKIVYSTAADMLRYVRGAYSNDAEYTETQAIEKYATATLLVIDELGVKLASDHDKAILFEVIDQRYQDVMPTVVISNLQANEMGEKIDERMIDRLKHNGTLLVFDWESYRGGDS